MSILNCLNGKLKGPLWRDVQEIHAQQMQRFNGDVTKADAELVRILESNSNSLKRAKQRAALTIVDQEKEINAALKAEQAHYDSLGKFSKSVRRMTRQVPSYVRTYTDRILNRVDNFAEERSRIALQEMPAVMRLIDSRPARKDPVAWEEFVRGMKDGPNVVKDLEVRQAVTEYRNYITKSENNLRAAGLQVGHVPNYIPIRHDFATIGKANQLDWKRAMDDAVDLGLVYNKRQHRVGVSQTDFDRITDSMYRRAVNGDAELAARRVRAEGTSGLTRGDSVTDLWGRHASDRIFHPKTADDYLRYVDAYGGGIENMDKMFLAHVNSVERDIATAQVMGPLPFDLNQRMLNRAQAAGAQQGQIDFANGMFQTAVNHWNGSVDSLMSRGWQTFQNYMSFNLLGSAPISAIGDQAMTGNMRRLMGFTDGDGRLSAFFANSNISRQDATRGAELAELMARNTVGRFDAHQEDALLSGLAEKSARLRDFSHRWTGLNAITEKASNQSTLIMFSSLSQKIERQAGWDTLTPEFKRLMARVGMNERDWQQLLKFDIKNVPDNFVTPNRVRGTNPDLALKLGALDVALRRATINAPDLFTRTLSSGRFAGQRAHGDATHLVMSSLMQFKSFPVGVWRNHFIPALIKAADGNGLMPLGLALLESTFFGAVALQLRSIASDKPPYDREHMMTKEFLLAALKQGGFAGLLGDIMLQDPNAYKASIIGQLAGPTATVSEKIAMNVFKQAVAFADGDPESGWDQASAVQAFRSLVPLQSHWYARVALERTLFDTLNSLDPDYYETINRRHNRLTEQRGAATLEQYLAR